MPKFVPESQSQGKLEAHKIKGILYLKLFLNIKKILIEYFVACKNYYLMSPIFVGINRE